MSTERERMRRILGMELAEAGRKAGVTGPIERKPPQEESEPEAGVQDILYFTGFDQYLAWLADRERE